MTHAIRITYGDVNGADALALGHENRLAEVSDDTSRTSATEGSALALMAFVAYAPTSDCDSGKIECLRQKLKKFYSVDHTFKN